MSGWTNKGKAEILGWAFRGATIPTNFYIALVTSATAPTADTNTMADLTEITAGNGYTSGGYQLTPNATDFDVLTENDASDLGLVQIKNVQWSASGGSIPPSGDGARYAVLTDDNATVNNREIYAYWGLGGDRTMPEFYTLRLRDLELDIL